MCCKLLYPGSKCQGIIGSVAASIGSRNEPVGGWRWIRTHNMRVILVDRKTLLSLAAAVVGPMILLVLFATPAEDLLKVIVELLR
jgi:uncharacterized membrane protein YeaQ/YmgE (transglycosylase-associated protein family)